MYFCIYFLPDSKRIRGVVDRPDQLVIVGEQIIIQPLGVRVACVDDRLRPAGQCRQHQQCQPPVTACCQGADSGRRRR